jgi:PAS domain-containing protein
MTGYSAEEAIPSLWRSDKQDAAFYEALWNTIAAGTVWRGELVNRKKDGSLYTEEMTVAPVRSAAGAISHYVAMMQDITQRKLAAQALQDAEQKYRSIFENAVLGIFQTNLEGEFLSVNPALARLAGYDSPEDFLSGVHSASEIYADLERRDELRGLIAAHKVVRALASVVVAIIFASGIFRRHREQLSQNQQATPPAAILCSNCGNYSAHGSIFCRNCGQKLG